MKVNLEEYDAFLVFTASRFTENDLKLALKIVKEVKKKVFFIRSKIDHSVNDERKGKLREFNEKETLTRIRSEFLESLGDLLTNEQDIFLISNYDPDKWDFARLTQAILDALPSLQRESLTLSLGNMTK